MIYFLFYVSLTQQWIKQFKKKKTARIEEDKKNSKKDTKVKQEKPEKEENFLRKTLKNA